MFKLDFMKEKEDDLRIFKNEIMNFKEDLFYIIRSGKEMTVKEFENFKMKKEAVADDIFVKYVFLTTNFQTEQNMATLNEMNKFLIEELKELNFSKENYKFIKSLICLNESDEIYVKNALKSMDENGINLDEKKQKELVRLSQEISQNRNDFNKNIMSARSNWNLIIPEEVINTLPENIKSYFNNGVLNYSISKINNILKECPDEKIREIVYNKNKEIANKGTEFDNYEIIKRNVVLKNEIAKILGFSSMGEKILKDTMSENLENAKSLLYGMRDNLISSSLEEQEELKKYYNEKIKEGDIPLFSNSYILDQIIQEKFDYKNNEERKYLNLKNVLSEIFNFSENMFGVKFKPVTSFFNDKNCINLLYFDVYVDGKLKSQALFDLFERENKKSGAWVNNLISTTKTDVGFQTLNTNFEKGKGLSFEDVRTLLHELGHLIHSVVSETVYANVSGTKGLPRDAVEIPSMTLEKFAYEEDFLSKASNGKMPKDLIRKAIDIDRFMSSSFYLRQVGISLYDLNIFNNDKTDVYDEYISIMKKTTGKEVDHTSNFPMTFSHIFSGGYTSGYYGYLWSEVYAADMFETLKKAPQLNGKRFRDEVLRFGATIPSKSLYEVFLGREVNVKAFNEYLGIKEERIIENANVSKKTRKFK